MEAPPLPIPNREVKLHSADGTAVRWESRSPPTPHNSGLVISYDRAFVIKYEGCCERTTSGRKKRNKKCRQNLETKNKVLLLQPLRKGSA